MYTKLPLSMTNCIGVPWVSVSENPPPIALRGEPYIDEGRNRQCAVGNWERRHHAGGENPVESGLHEIL